MAPPARLRTWLCKCCPPSHRVPQENGERREVCILVATSGDTGKAALEGFKDVEGTRIIVFIPDGVSDIQKLG